MVDVLLYGASGYMGKLCAREMLNRGLRPVLAGRSDAVTTVAAALGCEAAVFGLEDARRIERRLAGVTLVINLAGPFQATQRPLIRACLATGCHYIDIAGEVDEMRSAFAFDEAARDTGIMLMPGAGFGVVPTDIAALMAAQSLPDASELVILYATEGGVSRGTLQTVLRNIEQPGVRRVDGALVPARPAESHRAFTAAGRTLSAVYNPWRADLFTAGLSTGIPNIRTYSVFPGPIVRMMNGRLLWLRDLVLDRLLRFLPEGPSARQLRRGATYVTAIAANAAEEKAVSLKGPEAYLFTARCVRAIAARVIGGESAPGFRTPACFGKGLLDAVEDVEWLCPPEHTEPPGNASRRQAGVG